jgi:hypothetical protein
MKVIGHIRFIALMVLLIPFAGCNEDLGQITHISIDFPHGETRLHVDDKGEAYLYYGALPKALQVEKGVFDIKKVYKDLRSRLEPVVTNDKMRPGVSYGMVTISFKDKKKVDYFITDKDFADKLFRTARDNLIEKGQDFFDVPD